MSKLGKNGKPIYNESGKVMKGPNYFKPDLSKFVSQISNLKSIASTGVDRISIGSITHSAIAIDLKLEI